MVFSEIGQSFVRNDGNTNRLLPVSGKMPRRISIHFMRQISFETIRRDGYTIHLMGMPPPEHPPEAYFVAFVYKDGEPLVEGTPAPSTRYIVLEKTAMKGRVYALGEWDAAGNHKTHGFGNAEPTARDLIGHTFALLGIGAK